MTILNLVILIALQSSTPAPRQIDAGFNPILANADLDVLDSLLDLPGIRNRILREHYEGNWRYVGVKVEEMNAILRSWTDRSPRHKIMYVIGDRPWWLGAHDTERRVEFARAIATWNRPTLDRAIEDARQTLKGVPANQLIVEVGNSSDESGLETPFDWNPYKVTAISQVTVKNRWQAWCNLVRDQFTGSEVINRTASTRTTHLYLHSEVNPFFLHTWSGRISPTITELGVVGYPGLHDPALWQTLISAALRYGATTIVVHEPFMSDFGKQRAVLDGVFPKSRITTLAGAWETLRFEGREWPESHGGFCEPTVQAVWKAAFAR